MLSGERLKASSNSLAKSLIFTRKNHADRTWPWPTPCNTVYFYPIVQNACKNILKKVLFNTAPKPAINPYSNINPNAIEGFLLSRNAANTLEDLSK